MTRSPAWHLAPVKLLVLFIELTVESVKVLVMLRVHHVRQLVQQRLDHNRVVAEALKVVCR